jgi:DNA-binding transcriptional MerR regulator
MQNNSFISTKDTLTTKEVAEFLNVNEQTIYNYVAKGQLTPVNQENWQIEGTYHFSLEDIQKIEEKFTKPGLSTGDVAKQLRVSINTVIRYINEGLLPAIRKEYKGKERYFIQGEDLNEFEKGFEPRNRKQVILNKEFGYFLFQSFQHHQSHEFMRIMELDDQSGLAVSDSGMQLSISSLKEAGFEPIHLIEEKKAISKKGYAKLVFPQPKMLKTSIYNIIEFLICAAGPANVQLQVTPEEIEVRVKTILLPFEGNQSMEYINWLKKHLIEGKISIRMNSILIDSDYESIHAYVPSQVKKEIKRLAEKKGVTTEEFITQCLTTIVQQ